MSLIGNLSDIAVVDLMQFVHLGARTGTLVLKRDHDLAHISFHRGRIVSAWGPTSVSVCELLVMKGALQRSQLDAIVAEHAAMVAPVPLGQLLVAKGLVTSDAMKDAITHKVERTVFDLIGWTYGNFRFELDEVRGDQEIALVPGDVIQQLDINTEMVLIEALRLFDERNRAVAEAAPAPPALPLVDLATPSVQTIHLVTEDIELVARFGARIAADIGVRPVALRDAGAPAPGERPPLVLLDMRGNITARSIDRIRKRHPRSLVVAIVAPGADPSELYAAGVAAVVPPEAASIAACCGTLLNAGGAGTEEARTETHAGLARLRRVIADLRGGLVSATLSLNLMTIVADSVDRAILFLIQRDTMIALGAFGQHGDGHPLVSTSQGLTVPIGASGVLATCVAEGRACTVDYGPNLPNELRMMIDRPRSGQAVLFPVLGSRRVIALIYADNGKHLRSVDDVEIVEIATAQVGLAFENELLRRQLDRGAYAAY